MRAGLAAVLSSDPAIHVVGQASEGAPRSLVIEESTVKTRVKRIILKLDLHDRIHAVIFAYETGLAQPGPRPAA